MRADAPHFAERLAARVAQSKLDRQIVMCGERIASGLPEEVRPLIRYVFKRGRDCGSVPEFASANGMSVSTLTRRLSWIGLTPEEMLAWRRIIVALLINEHTLLKTDRVAFHAGYSSRGGLSNAMHGYLRVSREVALKRGGSDFAMRFLLEVTGRGGLTYTVMRCCVGDGVVRGV